MITVTMPEWLAVVIYIALMVDLVKQLFAFTNWFLRRRLEKQNGNSRG